MDIYNRSTRINPQDFNETPRDKREKRMTKTHMDERNSQHNVEQEPKIWRLERPIKMENRKAENFGKG